MHEVQGSFEAPTRRQRVIHRGRVKVAAIKLAQAIRPNSLAVIGSTLTQAVEGDQNLFAVVMETYNAGGIFPH